MRLITILVLLLVVSGCASFPYEKGSGKYLRNGITAGDHNTMMKSMNPHHRPNMLGNRINRAPITHEEMMQQHMHGGYGKPARTHKGMMCSMNPIHC